MTRTRTLSWVFAGLMTLGGCAAGGNISVGGANSSAGGSISTTIPL